MALLNDAWNGWTTPNRVGMWPGKPVEWTASQCAYEATKYAIRDAELSGRGRLGGQGKPNTYYDFSVLPAGYFQ